MTYGSIALKLLDQSNIGLERLGFYCLNEQRLLRPVHEMIESLTTKLRLTKGNAYYILGCVHASGVFSPINFDAAIAFLMLSDSLGDSRASYAIGVLYAEDPSLEKNLKEGIFWLRKSMALGNSDANLRLALIFEEFHFLGQDKAEFIRWLSLAADKGHVASKTVLAYYHYHGIYCQPDLSSAYRLWSCSAEKGDEHAQYMLGRMYDRGIGVAKNSKLAVYWWAHAAVQGNDTARYRLGKSLGLSLTQKTHLGKSIYTYLNLDPLSPQTSFCALGFMFLEGLRVERDWSLAISLFRKAELKGSPIAKLALSCCCEFEIGLTRNIRASRLLKAQALGSGLCLHTENAISDFFRYLTTEKDFEAVPFLLHLLHVKIFNRSPTPPLFVFRKILDKGVTDYELGRLSDILSAIGEGDGGESIYLSALLLLQSPDAQSHLVRVRNMFLASAAEGYDAAEYALGLCYEQGIGGECDIEKAASQMRLAASKSVVEAWHRLGVMYIRGAGVKQDLKAAMHFLRLAATVGHVEASFLLGRLYLDRNQDQNDIGNAWFWLKGAKLAGLVKADVLMGHVQNLGLRTTRRPRQALRYYVAAAEADDPMGLVYAGLSLITISSDAVGRSRGKRYLLRAGRSNIAEVKYAFSNFLLSKKSVRVHHSRALRELRLACELGSDRASADIELMDQHLSAGFCPILTHQVSLKPKIKVLVLGLEARNALGTMQASYPEFVVVESPMIEDPIPDRFAMFDVRTINPHGLSMGHMKAHTENCEVIRGAIDGLEMLVVVTSTGDPNYLRALRLISEVAKQEGCPLLSLIADQGPMFFDGLNYARNDELLTTLAAPITCFFSTPKQGYLSVVDPFIRPVLRNEVIWLSKVLKLFLTDAVRQVELGNYAACNLEDYGNDIAPSRAFYQEFGVENDVFWVFECLVAQALAIVADATQVQSIVVCLDLCQNFSVRNQHLLHSRLLAAFPKTSYRLLVGKNEKLSVHEQCLIMTVVGG